MSKITLVKQSKNHVCSITLRDLEGKRDHFEFVEDNKPVNPLIYMKLVLFSPSKQSNLGKKLSNKIQKHIDELVRDLISELDIKQAYFFTSFGSQKDKKDLAKEIKHNTEPFMALYCPNNFTESLYASIRNALAHGNIAQMGKYYYLYALSQKEANETSEKERKLTFLLKIYNVSKIEAYMRVFEKYN